MSLQKKIIRRINKQPLFKVHIKDTDIVSLSLLPTLNNVWPRHKQQIKQLQQEVRDLKGNSNINETNNNSSFKEPRQ